MDASGPITTNGSNAVGILADSSGTILRRSPGLLTDIEPINPPVPTATTGTVQVNATNVLTTGQFGTGISATAAGDVTVNIPPGGSVMGGWQADLTSGRPDLRSTGRRRYPEFDRRHATLTNDGSIGALSDRAVAGDPQVINNGTITGFVQFTGGDNSILNNGTFNLRHFADTNGDGVRDTLRVAVADLGDGRNNSFTNNGTLALPAVTGATTLDSTGQYLPLGNTEQRNDPRWTVAGPLLGVTTFTNSGTIDLQSNPVAGDVLVITGARQRRARTAARHVHFQRRPTLDRHRRSTRVAPLLDPTYWWSTTRLSAPVAQHAVCPQCRGRGALTVGDGILVVQALNGGTTATARLR